MIVSSSFSFEPELKEYFDMTTSKTHFISALMTRVLFVQESIDDCLQEDSCCFADPLPSVSILFLKNDWEPTLGKCSLSLNPFAWVFSGVISYASMFISLLQALHLDTCRLFPTFCNHGLYSSFSSHMSWKLVLHFTFNNILNWKRKVSQSYLPNIKKLPTRK